MFVVYLALVVWSLSRIVARAVHY